MDFYPSRDIFTKNIVLITGVHSSGKSMISPIISSFNRCENPRKDFSIEHIQILFHYGKISKDAAKYMLGSKIDFMLYDNLIGRNINMRFGDESSLWNAPDPASLFSRIGVKKGESIIKKDIEEGDAIFLLDTHNSVWHSEIWFECFPNIKIIDMQRHPIDVISSWYKSGLGGDIWKNKINQLLTLKWENSIVPYYSYGWEKLYINSSPIERVILMYDHVMSMHSISIQKICKNNQKKILNIDFDSMVTNPSDNIEKICNFIDTTETIDTAINKEQERIPRELKSSDRINKLAHIKKLAGDDCMKIINRHITQYEPINKRL